MHERHVALRGDRDAQPPAPDDERVLLDHARAMPPRETCSATSSFSPSRARREEHDVGAGALAHRVDERIVGVEHGVPLALRRPRGSRSSRRRAARPCGCRAGRGGRRDTLSTTPTSHSSKPSPARRMPPRAVSSTATSTVGFERMMFAANGPGHVALHHQAVLQVDAVGRREADGLPGVPEQVRDEPRRRRLAVRARHGDHRDRRLGARADTACR